MAYAQPTSSDLGLFLELDTVNGPRATLILGLSRALAETVVSPLPAGAEGTVLSIAARVYSNPQGLTTETTGPYAVGRPAGGLYLTRDERRTLGRLGGRGGAFTIDPTPADVRVPVLDSDAWAYWSQYASVNGIEWPFGVDVIPDPDPTLH